MVLICCAERVFRLCISVEPLLQIGTSVKHYNIMANSVAPDQTAHYKIIESVLVNRIERVNE